MFVEKNNPSPKKSLVIGSKNTTAILQIKNFLIFIYCDGLRFESVWSKKKYLGGKNYIQFQSLSHQGKPT